MVYCTLIFTVKSVLMLLIYGANMKIRNVYKAVVFEESKKSEKKMMLITLERGIYKSRIILQELTT